MLRLTVSPEEYLMIDDNIKIVFLGRNQESSPHHDDAPKEVNIVRSTVGAEPDHRSGGESEAS